MKESFYTRTSDGHDLYTVVWRSDQSQIKGSIQLCHGMAEHIGRYENFASECNRAGFHVFGHDCRGHGKTAENSGQFGDFGEKVDFNRLSKDVIEVRDYCDLKQPVILFGHSMGSFIARRVIQIAGHYRDVILSGSNGPLGMIGTPAILLSSLLTSYSPTSQATLLNQLSFGRFNSAVTDAETPFDWLSTDTKAVADYIIDPYCGFVPSNRFYKVLYQGIALIYQKKQITQIRKDIKILFVSGNQDPVSDFGKGIFRSASMYVNHGIKSVDVYLYENGRHEILNETNAGQVMNDILIWLDKNRRVGNE